MRILSGSLKDAEIPFKPQPGLRPTPDRVRKAMIDTLQPWEGMRVLDLFSGTGALGLEAVSAGAASVVFVESDRRRADEIAQLVRGLNLTGQCRVKKQDAWVALADLAGGDSFDRVLADPPYEKGLALKTLDFFKQGTCLNPGAWVVIETYKKEPLPDALGRLERRRSTPYGDTTLHYYSLV